MRKTKIFIVEANGRDKGKAFFIKEMSSLKAERWANRALVALANSGMPIVDFDEIKNMGMGALATLGLRAMANLPYEAVEPLFDEMFTCVSFVPDPSKPDRTRPIIEGDDGDIDEVATRYKLREEVFMLHAGFLLADLESKRTSASAQAA
jgi:hypothetical protein